MNVRNEKTATEPRNSLAIEALALAMGDAAVAISMANDDQINQDWENGITVVTYADGSVLVVDGSMLVVGGPSGVFIEY